MVPNAERIDPPTADRAHDDTRHSRWHASCSTEVVRSLSAVSTLVVVLVPFACVPAEPSGGVDDGIAEAGSAADAGPDADTGPHGDAATGGDDGPDGPDDAPTSSADATAGTMDSGTDEAEGGTSSGASSSDDGPPAPEACVGDESFDGQATWYELATPLVNCSYETDELPEYYGALNTEQYAGSAACGACVRVSGPEGSIDVQIVDQCPVASNPICVNGHIDLSVAAFDAIGAIADGIIPISWTWIACESPGPIEYVFKDGSSAFWAAVQIRNHRYAIDTVEWRGPDMQWHALARADYNYFVAEDGMGPPPFALRVTDVHGQALTDDDIPLEIMAPIPGDAQFPECVPK